MNQGCYDVYARYFDDPAKIIVTGRRSTPQRNVALGTRIIAAGARHGRESAGLNCIHTICPSKKVMVISCQLLSPNYFVLSSTNL